MGSKWLEQIKKLITYRINIILLSIGNNIIYFELKLFLYNSG